MLNLRVLFVCFVLSSKEGTWGYKERPRRKRLESNLWRTAYLFIKQILHVKNIFLKIRRIYIGSIL